MKDGLKKIYRQPYKLDEPSRDRVLWFDQDVLNSYLNGMYTELPIQLNFTDIDLPISEVKEEAIFYHFWGKKKPWTVKGFLFYKESFIKLCTETFLITIITLFIGTKEILLSIF